MIQNIKIKHMGCFIIMMVILLSGTACVMGDQLESSESAPIAVYPKHTPIAVAPPLPEQAVLVYRLFLELQVSNVGTASARAEDLAYRYGGYLVSTQSWYVDGRQNKTIVLAVPSEFALIIWSPRINDPSYGAAPATTVQSLSTKGTGPPAEIHSPLYFRAM